jgi:DNA invertase Pin-like site-specific DNA recombinase
MRTAIYARVSTDDKGQDTDNQILQMPAHELEFIDYATGKNTARPQFKAMMLAAEARQFDVLVFWSLDRLTRSGIEGTLAILRRLTDLGIKWKSVKEPFLDTTQPTGSLMIAIFSWIAEQERIRLSDRTKAGMARVKANGSESGRPIGRPQLNLEARCKQLKDEGLRPRDIAHRLRVSRTYVYTALYGSGQPDAR